MGDRLVEEARYDRMNDKSATKLVRRYNSFTTAYNTNLMYLKNPWVVAWWSAAFPGFGHLNLGCYLKGFLLVFWEIVINNNAEINKAMVYSFNGQFEVAKEVLNPRWLLLYIPVYIYAIWDSFRKTIDLNKHCLLAESENAPITIFKMNGLALNVLEKRPPSLALVWSLLFPGLGHLYLNRLPSGFFFVVCCIIISYCSHLVDASLYTIVGSLEQAQAVLDQQWFIYYPSMYCFAAYEAYKIAIEQNKLYEKEQFRFLRKNVQPRSFRLLGSNRNEGN
jgi:TM2 domain-containing membrane protein YozV